MYLKEIKKVGVQTISLLEIHQYKGVDWFYRKMVTNENSLIISMQSNLPTGARRRPEQAQTCNQTSLVHDTMLNHKSKMAQGHLECKMMSLVEVISLPCINMNYLVLKSQVVNAIPEQKGLDYMFYLQLSGRW